MKTKRIVYFLISAIFIFGSIYLGHMGMLQTHIYSEMLRGKYFYTEIESYRKLPFSDKETLLFNEMLLYLKIKHFETVLEIQEELSKSKNRDLAFSSTFLTAFMYYNLGFPYESHIYLKEALRINPENLEAKLLLEKLYKENEKLQEVEKGQKNKKGKLKPGDKDGGQKGSKTDREDAI